jgi:hypothetical protein
VPHDLLQRDAYRYYFGDIPEGGTIHFKDGDRSNADKDNLYLMEYGPIVHSKKYWSRLKKRPPSYCQAIDGQIYIWVADDNSQGFTIIDENESWPGGLGLAQPITCKPDDDWVIDQKVRDRLGFILEGAREMYKRKQEEAK